MGKLTSTNQTVKKKDQNQKGYNNIGKGCAGAIAEVVLMRKLLKGATGGGQRVGNQGSLGKSP